MTSSFLPCLSATTELTDIDTSNSAASNVFLQSQTASFSTDKIEQIQSQLTESSLSPEIAKDKNQTKTLNSSNNLKVLNQLDDLQGSTLIYLRRVVSVTLENAINSKLAKTGDNISAKLKENLYYGTRLIAPANSSLKGRIFSIRDPRTLSQATLKR